MVPLAESHALGKRSKQRRCKACFNSRRSLQQWYAKMERSHEWETMDPEEKSKMILENKCNGKGKGRKRQIKVEEKATCTDKVGLDQGAPFQTKKQLLGLQCKPVKLNFRTKIWSFFSPAMYFYFCPRFIAELKSRYDWSDQQYERDPFLHLEFARFIILES